MVIAADYPFLDVFWTMVIFFAWVIWIWMMVVILTDVFRRRDIGGWAKTAWCVFMIVLPFLGVFVYLIAQHDEMAERAQERAELSERQFDQRVRTVSADGAASEIEKAERLLMRGTITQAEFETIKGRAIAAH